MMSTGVLYMRVVLFSSLFHNIASECWSSESVVVKEEVNIKTAQPEVILTCSFQFPPDQLASFQWMESQFVVHETWLKHGRPLMNLDYPVLLKGESHHLQSKRGKSNLTLYRRSEGKTFTCMVTLTDNRTCAAKVVVSSDLFEALRSDPRELHRQRRDAEQEQNLNITTPFEPARETQKSKPWSRSAVYGLFGLILVAVIFILVILKATGRYPKITPSQCCQNEEYSGAEVV